MQVNRNRSIQQHFERIARLHRPAHRFAGTDADDWRRWASDLRPQVLATLGNLPPRVPPNPQVIVEWEADGLLKQKVCFDVEEGLSVFGLIFRPPDRSGPLPAILCCHGHGPYGKDAVMGDRGCPQRAAHIQELNYDYGLQMARAGFVTMAIDWRGFGERNDRLAPFFHQSDDKRDLCNLHFLRAAMMGQTMLGLNLHDAACALDLLCEQPFVDADRLGVMGLSLGGTMATWIALSDERIKAADVIGYADRFADFAMRDNNFCGSQMTPGLFALCDVPDLQGLIAPRPLLIEIAVHDRCFAIDSAMSCFRALQTIYAAAGADDRLELDLFEGGHAWGGRKSDEFFRKNL